MEVVSVKVVEAVEEAALGPLCIQSIHCRLRKSTYLPKASHV
jgi:hypothetical protein